MTSVYEHIRIQKEPLINDRRTRTYNIPQVTRGNIFEHAQRLRGDLSGALNVVRQQPASDTSRLVLKLRYTGMLNFNNLQQHGVEFISQEASHVCIVFASEQGVAEFASNIERLGLGDEELTYKQILMALEGVDSWSREDRESWAVKNFGLPNEITFKLDIELWPVGQSNQPVRHQLLQGFDRWLSERDISVIDRINQDSLVLYRLRVNSDQAELLFEHRDIRLVDLPPRTGIAYQHLDVDINDLPQSIPSPSADSARVCILDSGVNSNHPLIAPAFAEGESYIPGVSENDDVGHGSAVAGIALYGDLEACLASNYWVPEFRVYSGKILYKEPATGQAIFDEKTIEKTIEEAVNYFAGELGCRIFNLSIGNENSPYDNKHIRGLAYTLDRLARKYDILFVVSAGNFTGTQEIPRNSWREEYPEYLTVEESIIIDPAPALNVITVGALARHTAGVNEQRYGENEVNALAPAGEDQPSPFTRHGPSVKGALKPELMAPGGNVASPLRIPGQQWNADYRGLGVLTLNHEHIGNTLLKELSGTSFAAPYITHLAGRLLNIYPNASANLLRALLVNHANLLAPIVDAFPGQEEDFARTVAGYGKIDVENLFRSTESTVVLMAEDSIKNDAHQFYELPLPSEFLRGNRASRQLRVTLAFCPPVRTTRLDYIATKMSFRLVKGNSLEEIQRHFNHSTQRQAETINDASTTNRTITSQQREKGTVQSSIWNFRQLSPRNKWFVVITRQDREWGEVLCLEEERYALVVTVEDRDNEEAQLYTQIQQRVQEQERVRARVVQ